MFLFDFIYCIFNLQSFSHSLSAREVHFSFRDELCSYTNQFSNSCLLSLLRIIALISFSSVKGVFLYPATVKYRKTRKVIDKRRCLVFFRNFCPFLSRTLVNIIFSPQDTFLVDYFSTIIFSEQYYFCGIFLFLGIYYTISSVVFLHLPLERHNLCQSVVHALRFFCASFDRTFYLPLPKFLFPVPSHFDVLFCRLIFSTFYRRTAMSCGVLSSDCLSFSHTIFSDSPSFLLVFVAIFFSFFFFSSHFTILFPSF